MEKYAEKWIVMMQIPADCIVSVEPTEEMAEEVVYEFTNAVEDCVLVFPVPKYEYIGWWA